MAAIRPLIPDEKWNALSAEARAAISEVDFKTRTSGFLKSIKPKILDILKAGKPLNLRDICTKETDRLLRTRKISPDEVGHVREYVLEQVTGTVSVKKDHDGLRLYLCVGDRTYVARSKAPKEAWTKYALELADERASTQDRLIKWAELYKERFGNLPAELHAAVSSDARRADSERSSHHSSKTAVDA